MERNFKCSFPGCDKAYGSDNSLNQHVRLKHPQLYEVMRRGSVDGCDDSDEDENKKGSSVNVKEENMKKCELDAAREDVYYGDEDLGEEDQP